MTKHYYESDIACMKLLTSYDKRSKPIYIRNGEDGEHHYYVFETLDEFIEYKKKYNLYDHIHSCFDMADKLIVCGYDCQKGKSSSDVVVKSKNIGVYQNKWTKTVYIVKEW